MSENSEANPNASDLKSAKIRTKSETAFPYFGLEKSIDVARVIHDRAGGRCTRAQLASLLNYTGVKNGGFLTRVSAAKMFGLIDELGDAIILTDRVKKILAPVLPADEEQARLDAFMSVELYRRVFEDFDGQTLPSPAGLKNKVLHDYRVVPAQVETAVRNLMDSAEAAGLFRVAGTRQRMIKPIIVARGESASPAYSSFTSQATAQDTPQRQPSGQGSESDASDIHPALLGLLRNLPPVGSKLSPKRRAALTEAFKSTVNFIWPEEDDE